MFLEPCVGQPQHGRRRPPQWQLIQVENEEDEVFKLLIAEFQRQSRETFKQSGVDMHMDASRFPLCPDGLFKYPVQTVPEG